MTTISRGTVFTVLLLIVVKVSVSAQTISLSGVVKSKMGRPVIGASVTLAGDGSVTAETDSSGNFLLIGERVGVVGTRTSSSTPVVGFLQGRLRLVTTQPSPVSVTVFSTLGRRVASHSFFIATPGTHLVTLPAEIHTAGYYLVQVEIAGKRIASSYLPSISGTTFSTLSKQNQLTKQHTATRTTATIAQIVDDTIIVRARGYEECVHPIASYERTGIIITLDPVSRLTAITRSCDGLMPSPVSGGQKGWGSRYWDCCKPHCSSPFNTQHLCANCDSSGIDEVPCFVKEGNEWSTWDKATESSCQGGIAYACYRHVPFAVCEKLAYGYAAVPGSIGEDMCGKCFQLDFGGGSSNNDVKAAHLMMKGKTMIVIASNIGHDVHGGQFDIMIPGGGLGAFREGCQKQWGVDVNDENLVGNNLGGLISSCQSKHGWDADLDVLKECVRGKCDNLFGRDPALHDLWEGCIWFVDWMHAVDNATFSYKQVPCPEELVDMYYSTKHPRP